MEPIEFERLNAVDRDHWFYKGKREIAEFWISGFLELRPENLLVDGGMGTGRWVCEMRPLCNVVGLDSYEDSIRLAAPRVHSCGGRVIRAELTALPLRDGCAAVVTLFDVLEHLPNPEVAYAEALRVTRPGGLIVITVPALKCLWSDWDVSLHHYRRYGKGELLRLLTVDGAEVLHCVYTNAVALPAMLIVRGLRRVFPSAPKSQRAEDRIPPATLNRILRMLFTIPAKWKWFRPPVGASLLAVIRRR